MIPLQRDITHNLIKINKYKEEMKKPFKKLFGYRVYLLAPKVDSKNVLLSEESKRQMSKAKMQDFMKLEVYAIGDLVQTVKEGDIVLVDDVALSNAPFIDLTEDLSVIVIDVHNIIQVW